MKIYFKKAYEIMTKNSALIEVLILCSLTVLLILMFFTSRILSNKMAVMAFFFLISILALAFMSGWLNVIKFAVDNNPEVEKTDFSYFDKVSRYNINSFKSFFPGVSEYFLPVLGFYFVLALFLTVLFYVFYKIGIYFFPAYFDYIQSTIITLSKINNILAFEKFLFSNKSLILFIFCLRVVVYIIQYLLLFCLPILYFKTKNPFKVIFSSIGFVFKNFGQTLGLYFILTAISIGLNILAPLFNFPILSFIFLLVVYAYITYITTVVFIFFRQAMLRETIEKINSQDVFIKSTSIESEPNEDR